MIYTYIYKKNAYQCDTYPITESMVSWLRKLGCLVQRRKNALG